MTNLDAMIHIEDTVPQRLQKITDYVDELRDELDSVSAGLKQLEEQLKLMQKGVIA